VIITLRLKTYILEPSENELKIATEKVGRKILSALKDAYPRGLTTKELVEKTGEAESTIYSYKMKLEKDNFIKELKTRKSGPGRPSSGDIQLDSRSSKYIIENANYLNYSKDRYKLAPGNVEYPSEFLNLCNRFFDEENEKELYRILLSIISRIQRRVMESDDEESKRWAPTSGKEYCCANCGCNHEARDFIRALLLRVMDRFEIHDEFLSFMAENQYISKDSLQQYTAPTMPLSKGKPQFGLKEKESGTGSTILRILSIERDIGEDQILFLAINKDGKFLCGTIDKELVTDDMTSNTMIKCLTNDIIMDTEIGHYIGLSKDDSFVEVTNDDLSFPKVSELISKIGVILSTSEEDKEDQYIVEGVIIQKKDIQLVNVNEPSDTIPGTQVLLRDDTGTIRLTNLRDQILNKLTMGDKIQVTGAYLYEDSSGKELRKGAYGSIIKIGTEHVGDVNVVSTVDLCCSSFNPFCSNFL
jgi:hypothetical protein